MHKNFVKEHKNGRVHKRIELLHVPLSEKMQEEVNKVRAQASNENTK